LPNWGLIDTNRSKTSYSIASVDDAVGLNVDRRAGWEWVEHSVLTHLMLGSVAVRTMACSWQDWHTLHALGNSLAMN